MRGPSDLMPRYRSFDVRLSQELLQETTFIFERRLLLFSTRSQRSIQSLAVR